MDISDQCVILVLLEMGLSFVGIVLNLLIVTTIRQEESLKGSTLNFLLLNLCLSNLIIAFLVKPISAIYIGYAFSTGQNQVGLAFCTLYTFVYRSTWCIFPFSLAALCWCKLLAHLRCKMWILICCPNLQKKAAKLAAAVGGGGGGGGGGGNGEEVAATIEATTDLPRLMMRDNSDEIAAVVTSVDLEDDKKMLPAKTSTAEDTNRSTEETPTAMQKVLVLTIWFSSAFFGVMTCIPDKVFGVELSQKILEEQLKKSSPSSSVSSREDVADMTYCIVRTGVNDLLDYIAIVVVLIIPLLLGPVLVAVLQTLICLCDRFLCCSSHATDEKTNRSNDGEDNGSATGCNSGSHHHNNNNSSSDDDDDGLPCWKMLISFTLSLVATYPAHMYVAEVYVEDSFTFFFVKYCVGNLFVLLVPIITLYLEGDIRLGIKKVLRGSVLCSLQQQQQC